MTDQTTTAPTDEQILAEIRNQLDAMKVPGAQEATMDQQWGDLDVDSLELVELVKALEDSFGIQIADEELKPIKGVGDAVRLTQRLVASRGTA